MWLALALTTLLAPPNLDLPARPSQSPTGSQFAQSILGLSLEDRERQLEAQVLAGNVPSFLRSFIPITVTTGETTITIRVAPDYLSVGSDLDHFLTPLSPNSAIKLASRLGCVLPTTRIVDLIYERATVKLEPRPIPPSAEMTTVPVFLRHNSVVQEQRREKGQPGQLVAGHKKDVVLTQRLVDRPENVAIYGWHRLDGRPIQPLYVRHKSTWVDYSHGIRLIDRTAIVNGRPTPIENVLSDPALASSLSAEGPMSVADFDILTHSNAEHDETLSVEPGVRIRINRPRTMSARPVLLVFYACPNGNTIEQTWGKTTKVGDDWHFDIQHVGAQIRFVRDARPERCVVLVCLENNLKSWPSWRRKHGDDRIPGLIQLIADRFDAKTTTRVYTGHSGGGSLWFGYLNAVDSIPTQVDRMAFLDSNYAYDTEKHRDKIIKWIDQSRTHRLSVFAYNDAVALLDGKTFVSKEGGTWGRSLRMMSDFGESMKFSKQQAGDLTCFRAKDGQVEFQMLENPERRIFHTVQVERNGLIQSLLSGTEHEGRGYRYWGPRAYTRFIRAE